MVRQRSLVGRALAALCALCSSLALIAAGGDDAPSSAAANPSTSTRTANPPTANPARTGAAAGGSSAKQSEEPASQAKDSSSSESAEPIDRRPYAIRAWVAVDPGTRIDKRGLARLLTSWQSLVRRFVGSPWILENAEGDGPLARARLEDLRPEDMTGLAKGCDKAWAIRVEQDGNGYVFSGREYDVLTGRLGNVCKRTARYPADAPRGLLALGLDMFLPTAEIGPLEGGGVQVTVRGASLPASSAYGQVVSTGSVFRPLRIYLKPDDSVIKIDDIRRSYLRVTALDGPVAKCEIVSSYRDPLSARVVRKNKLVALGVKPASIPTRMRFVLSEPAPKAPAKNKGEVDRKPMAGYILTARHVPDGPPQEVGITDREGRVVLEPNFAQGLVIVRLVAAEIEPLVEFPTMPGEMPEEQILRIAAKPLTVTLETQLNALRDELIDLVATRARIESRLKARADGQKWDEVEALLKEYRELTPREEYVQRLNTLKDDAAHKQAETKTAILTKTANGLITDTQSLIDRYLDDDAFKAYAEGLAQARAQGSQPAPKAAANKTAPENTPINTNPPVASKPSTPAPASPPAARPQPKAPAAPPPAAPAPAPAPPKNAVPF